MARGINKVILIGHLGADPEVRNTSGGMVVANLRLATTESWRDRQSGQQQDRTERHRVVLFGRQAELAQQYLKKGNQVYIEGRLQTRKWQDKQSGQDRYSTEIVGNDIQFLGGRGSGSDAGAGSRGGDSNPPPDDYGSGGGYAGASGGSGSYANAGGGGSPGGGANEPREDFDDEIPF
jgi:single-strand DNA-binding protein